VTEQPCAGNVCVLIINPNTHTPLPTTTQQSTLTQLQRPGKSDRTLMRQRAAQRDAEAAERTAADAQMQLKALEAQRADLEKENRRMAKLVAKLQAAYSAATAAAVRQASASLEMERDMAELTSLAAAAAEVEEHAEMAQEELRLLAEALGGHLTRAEKRATAAAEAAAAAAAADQAREENILIANADAILSNAEQLILASEQQQQGVESTHPTTTEKLLWFNRTADSLAKATKEAAGGSAAVSSKSKEDAAAAAAAAAEVVAVFGAPPSLPGMQDFLSDLIRSSQQLAASKDKGAAAAPAGEPKAATAPAQAASQQPADDTPAEPASSTAHQGAVGSEPVTLWLRHWSAAPGWDTKTAWLQDWARSQMEEVRQTAAQSSGAAAAASSRVVRDLKEKVLAACALVAGLTDRLADNLWPDDDDADGADGSGKGSATEQPQAQTEYGPDGGGMDRTGGDDDGGAGKGKGGGDGGSGSQPGGEGGGAGKDGGAGKPPGGGGGSGGGGGPPDPWDGFESFPPGGGMDPAIVLPVAFAAAMSLAAGLLNAGKRAATPAATVSRAASPAGVEAAPVEHPGPKQRRLEEPREPAGAAASHAGGKVASYDALRSEPLAGAAARQFGAPFSGSVEILVAADEAARLVDDAADRLRRQVASAAAEPPVATLGMAAAGESETTELLHDLHPTRLRNMTWTQLDELPAQAQCELFTLRSEAHKGRCERRALLRRLRQVERALVERDAELESSHLRGAALQTALESAVAQVRVLGVVGAGLMGWEGRAFYGLGGACVQDFSLAGFFCQLTHQRNHNNHQPTITLQGRRYCGRCAWQGPRSISISRTGLPQGTHFRQLRSSRHHQEAPLLHCCRHTH